MELTLTTDYKAKQLANVNNKAVKIVLKRYNHIKEEEEACFSLIAEDESWKKNYERRHLELLGVVPIISQLYDEYCKEQ